MVSEKIENKIQTNVSLKKLNTFGVDVKAKEFLQIENEKHLGTFFKTTESDSITILGGGSNILFTKDIEGLLLFNQLKGIEVKERTDTTVLVEVGGGENWHAFVLWCLSNNFYGIENLSLIPGTVGAAPIQNIGAYGVEAKDYIEQVAYYDLEVGQKHFLEAADCQFGYRDSIFKRSLKGKTFISSVFFRLSLVPDLNIKYGAIEAQLEKNKVVDLTPSAVSKAVIDIRSSKLPDPSLIGNCGSFFKNPVVESAVFEAIYASYPAMPHYKVGDHLIKIPAGWLIERCGFKGKSFGRVGVHAKQALVLINLGNADGVEAVALATKIQETVFTEFGIKLEAEVNIW